MSFNPAFGQPQAQMAPQLPYPTTQFTANPFPVQPGHVPLLPPTQYMPQALSQAHAYIVSAAIDAIQAKAQQGPLRIFLFNQMADNGYNNQAFTKFCDMLIRMIEVKAAQQQIRDVQGGAVSCANLLAEMTIAVNVNEHPALLQVVDQQTVQNVQIMLQQYNQLMQEMQMFYNRQQQVVQQPQGVQWPGQQVQQPQGFGGSVFGQQQQPAQGSNWRQAQQTHQVQAAGVNPNISTGGFGASPFSGTGDALVDRFQGAHRDGSPPVRPVTNHVQNIQTDEQRRAAQQSVFAQVSTGVSTQQGLVKAVAAGVLVKAGTPGAFFKPSRDAEVTTETEHPTPINIAFNPNTSDLYYQTTPTGQIRPIIKNKEENEMDMSKHLTPSFVSVAPAGIEAVDSKVRVFETESALKDDALKIAQVEPVGTLVEAYKDKAFRTDISLDDMWLGNEVQLALMRRTQKRSNVYRSCSALLEPLVCGKDPKSMITAIAASPSFEAACRQMQTYLAQLKAGDCPHGDAKALAFINKRLTTWLNNYLKKELAVSVGWTDNFMEEAMAVPKFLSDNVGPLYGKKLAENQAKIIAAALEFIAKDLEDQQNNNLLPDSDVDKILTNGNVFVTYFFEYITLTSLELFSPELNFDMPPGSETSVGVFAAQVPLMRQIADNIFTHERALNIPFHRHLVRTGDGVTLEFTLSAMNPDFYLVCPADL